MFESGAPWPWSHSASSGLDSSGGDGLSGLSPGRLVLEIEGLEGGRGGGPGHCQPPHNVRGVRFLCAGDRDLAAHVAWTFHNFHDNPAGPGIVPCRDPRLRETVVLITQQRLPLNRLQQFIQRRQRVRGLGEDQGVLFRACRTAWAENVLVPSNTTRCRL